VCVNDLMKLNMWSPEMKNLICHFSLIHSFSSTLGSIQRITSIPKDIRDLYKTVWEVSQKALIDLAADRGAFIDQSQVCVCVCDTDVVHMCKQSRCSEYLFSFFFSIHSFIHSFTHSFIHSLSPSTFTCRTQTSENSLRCTSMGGREV